MHFTAKNIFASSSFHFSLFLSRISNSVSTSTFERWFNKHVNVIYNKKKKNVFMNVARLKPLAWRRLDNWEARPASGLSWICADVQSRFCRLRGLAPCVCHMTIPSVAHATERCKEVRDPAIGRPTYDRGAGESILQASKPNLNETESKGAPESRDAPRKMQLAKYRMLRVV